MVVVLAIARVVQAFGVETWGAPSFFWILALVPTAAGRAISSRFVRRRVAARRARRRQIATDRVQVLRVENARVVEHEAYNDEGPTYYFGIGARKVLCLRGPWMFDRDYGLAPLDPKQEHLLLPAEAFTVHRLTVEGDVLNIDDVGPYLPPEAILPFKAALPSWTTPVRENWASGLVAARWRLRGIGRHCTEE